MLFAIALGGAAGTLARFGVGAYAQRFSSTFPFSTLAINVLGSFLLGFLMRYFLATAAAPELRVGLTVGFCGGFTTFSTFSYETVRLLEQGSYARAGTYVTASVVLSILATFAGFAAARGVLAPSS